MTEQKPSIGRVVHYAAYTANGTACVPAMINQLTEDGHGQVVGLCVFDPRGIQMHGGCVQDELPPAGKIVSGERTEHQGHTWHWPERVG